MDGEEDLATGESSIPGQTVVGARHGGVGEDLGEVGELLLRGIWKRFRPCSVPSFWAGIKREPAGIQWLRMK